MQGDTHILMLHTPKSNPIYDAKKPTVSGSGPPDELAATVSLGTAAFGSAEENVYTFDYRGDARDFADDEKRPSETTANKFPHNFEHHLSDEQLKDMVSPRNYWNEGDGTATPKTTPSENYSNTCWSLLFLRVIQLKGAVIKSISILDQDTAEYILDGDTAEATAFRNAFPNVTLGRTRHLGLLWKYFFQSTSPKASDWLFLLLKELVDTVAKARDVDDTVILKDLCSFPGTKFLAELLLRCESPSPSKRKEAMSKSKSFYNRVKGGWYVCLENHLSVRKLRQLFAGERQL